MDELSLTTSQRRTAKKREKKKRRQQAKGMPAAHPPPTRPGPLSSAAVLREQSESSRDDEENGPDKAEAEKNQPEESTLAEDVIESLALHAPDMPLVPPVVITISRSQAGGSVPLLKHFSSCA